MRTLSHSEPLAQDVLLNTALLATLPRDRLWLADHDTEQLDVERNQTRRLLVELCA